LGVLEANKTKLEARRDGNQAHTKDFVEAFEGLEHPRRRELMKAIEDESIKAAAAVATVAAAPAAGSGAEPVESRRSSPSR